MWVKLWLWLVVNGVVMVGVGVNMVMVSMVGVVLVETVLVGVVLIIGGYWCGHGSDRYGNRDGCGGSGG